MIGPLAGIYMLLFCGSFALYVYLAYPIVFIHLYFRFSVWYSGMTLKFIEIDGLSICYGEKGRKKKGQPSMVLIHGFTADKFMWVPLVKNLPSDVHVVAVDLPGHGDSDTPTEHMEISHTETVKRMYCMFNQLVCEPIHLVGMSMGGALVGLYAANHPETVHSLTMICPAMKTPRETPFWQQMSAAIADGVEEIHTVCDLLFPLTAEDVRKMLDCVQHHNMWIPSQILRGVADWRKRYYPFYARLFKTITDPNMHSLLESHLDRIKAPTQVIWGEKDRIIDPSGAELLREKLPNCIQVDIIPNCGHSMSTDRPGAMTKSIVTFRRKVDQL